MDELQRQLRRMGLQALDCETELMEPEIRVRPFVAFGLARPKQTAPGVWSFSSRSLIRPLGPLMFGVLGLTWWLFSELTRNPTEAATPGVVIAVGLIGTLLAIPLWFVYETYTFDSGRGNIRHTRVRPWGASSGTFEPEAFKIARAMISVRNKHGWTAFDTLVAVPPTGERSIVLAATRSPQKLDQYIGELPHFIRERFDPDLKIRVGTPYGLSVPSRS